MRFLLQQLAVQNDRVERRPQLVAHAGEELALGAGGGFGLALRDAQLFDERRQLRGVVTFGVVRVLEVARLARELLFGALALRDVAHVAREERHAHRRDRRDRHFHRELARRPCGARSARRGD